MTLRTDLEASLELESLRARLSAAFGEPIHIDPTDFLARVIGLA